MLLPVQNQQASGHWYDDQSVDFGVLDLGEELYENDSMQCHEEFDKETSAWQKWNKIFR